MSNRYLVPSASTAALTVFYDGDCGFCMRCVNLLRRIDRQRDLDLVPLQDARRVAADAPSTETLLELMHVRDRDGEWFVGGRAWVAVADIVPVLRPVGWLAGLPIVSTIVDRGYVVIARGRARISLLFGDDACNSNRQEAVR